MAADELKLSDLGFGDKKREKLADLLAQYNRQKSMADTYEEKAKATRDEILALIPYNGKKVKDRIGNIEFTRSQQQRTYLDKDAAKQDKRGIQLLANYDQIKSDLEAKFPKLVEVDTLSVRRK